MENGLTSLETVNEVQKLVDLLFQANSIHDNIVYAMATYLNVPNFYDYMHHTISHDFPKLADNITDFGITRNDVFHRGALSANNKEYTDIIDCLQDSYNILLIIQTQINSCIDAAVKNNDKAFEDFLRDFNFNKFSIYLKQIKNFLVGAKQYNDDGVLSLFNKNYKSYVIM